MRICLLVGFILLVLAVANRVDERLLEYRSLLRERDALEREKRALLLEDGYAKSGAVYLVVDLGARTITAKMAGVPLRKTEITWMYGRPGAAAVFDTFRVAAVKVDSARVDTVPAPPPVAKAKPDSLRADNLSARIDSLLASSTEAFGAPPDTLAHLRRYRMNLRQGPALWLASLPPAQTHWDSLETQFDLWCASLSRILRTQDLYLFVPPGDAPWIAATAQLDSVRVDTASTRPKGAVREEPVGEPKGGAPPPSRPAPASPGVGLLLLSSF